MTTEEEIIKEFELKGFKFIETKKGFRFTKQIGTQKHNQEVLFYKDFHELIKFHKNDLK